MQSHVQSFKSFVVQTCHSSGASTVIKVVVLYLFFDGEGLVEGVAGPYIVALHEASVGFHDAVVVA